MVLRKWRTNSSKLKQKIPSNLLELDDTPVSLRPPNQAPKALGVHWDVVSDTFHVSISVAIPCSKAVTKRSIASGTAGVFDILGLFCPAVNPARIIFQETWKRSLSWDKPVPDDIRVRWETWIDDLPSINNHAVPRRISPSSGTPPTSRSLHGFCDAFAVAYGAAIYLRTEHADGRVFTALVIAKARVLPVKPTTIPRVELTGAHLLAKLLSHTRTLLNIPTEQVHAWTDSQIVLHWLPKTPPQMDRFVANRVYSIQQLLPNVIWRHVSSSDNPADLASRGVRAPDLATSALWWSGLPWLLLPSHNWPSHKMSKPAVPLFCVTIKPCLQTPDEQAGFLRDLWTRFSSFFKFIRVIVWIYRFTRNCNRDKSKHRSGLLVYEEIISAKHLLYTLSTRVLSRRLPRHPEVYQLPQRPHPLQIFAQAIWARTHPSLQQSSRSGRPNVASPTHTAQPQISSHQTPGQNAPPHLLPCWSHSHDVHLGQLVPHSKPPQPVEVREQDMRSLPACLCQIPEGSLESSVGNYPHKYYLTYC